MRNGGHLGRSEAAEFPEIVRRTQGQSRGRSYFKAFALSISFTSASVTGPG